ncbi:MAG: hypothetical protein KJ622_18440 [Alphaproteobacteria bacterium]|nr:hypothetical protein [Alphaproteobacteria bacterium]
MRWILGLLLAVLVALTLSVATLVLLVPDTAIERHILTAAGRAAGSSITTTGLPEISLFPAIDMTLNGVDMKPSGADGKLAIKAGKVAAQVGWLPILISWTIDIAELRLAEPVIRFDNARASGSPVIEPEKRRTLYRSPAVLVRRVAIENGAIDGVSGWRLNNVNAAFEVVDGGSATDPVGAGGMFRLRGEGTADLVPGSGKAGWPLSIPELSGSLSIPVRISGNGDRLSVGFDWQRLTGRRAVQSAIQVDAGIQSSDEPSPDPVLERLSQELQSMLAGIGISAAGDGSPSPRTGD